MHHGEILVPLPGAPQIVQVSFDSSVGRMEDYGEWPSTISTAPAGPGMTQDAG